MAKHGLQEQLIWHRRALAINAFLTVVGMNIEKTITTLMAIKSFRTPTTGEELTIPAEVLQDFKLAPHTLKSGY